MVYMNKGMKGFTIIELVVSIAIFAFMTALVISKYGTFNQNTLLVNVAYDMALTVRTAQSYGLSVKSADGTNTFNAPYGVHFDMKDTSHFKLFVDTLNKGFYDSSYPTESITTYTLNSGAVISSICLGTQLSDCSNSSNLLSKTNGDTLDITYKRPNPDAIFCKNGSGTSFCPTSNLIVNSPVVFITITSSDGSNSQNIVIRKNGQISVGNQ